MDVRPEYNQLVAAVSHVRQVVDTGGRLIGNKLGWNDGARPDKEALRVAAVFTPSAVAYAETGTVDVLATQVNLSVDGQRARDYGALVVLAHELSTAHVKISIGLSNGVLIT
ncbi:MAG: hypothetical protein AB7L13_19260 [Acidimicrobiia bacterium]